MPGDLVLTAAGPAPILWRGHCALDRAALQAAPHLRPIRLAAGHYGLERDLIVSPQHGLALGAALVRARHLVQAGRGARMARGIQRVTYHHLLLPAHALIWAEGALTESVSPGPEAIRALAPADRLDLARTLAPLARHPGQSLTALYGPRILPLLPKKPALAAMRGLVQRIDSGARNCPSCGKNRPRQETNLTAR